jgi:hypothetical protein
MRRHQRNASAIPLRLARDEQKECRLSRKASNAPSKGNGPDKVTVAVREGDDTALKAAEAMTGPYIPAAIATSAFTRGTIGELELDKIVTAMVESAKRVKQGDMRDVEAILMSQATALNSMFADLVNRSANNRNAGYFDASQAYLKMAFKAQNQCRMTLETLSTIKNPPVVYARQANIAHGPQQVNNGTAVPSHAEKFGKPPNELLEHGNEQRLDTGTAGAAGSSNQAVEAVGEVNGAKDHGGQGCSVTQRL